MLPAGPAPSYGLSADILAILYPVVSAVPTHPKSLVLFQWWVLKGVQVPMMFLSLYSYFFLLFSFYVFYLNLL